MMSKSDPAAALTKSDAPANTPTGVLDWVATVGSVSGVLGSMAVFDVIQRVANLFGGTHAQQQAAVSMARSINRAVRLTGAVNRIEGREHVTPGQNYIIVANHQSLFDISMISEVFAELEPRYISKKQLSSGVPGVSYNLRMGGSALIDRKDPFQSREAISEIARRVHESKWTVAIFPEGTRSKTGEMKAFREGGLRELVSRAPGVPILPVTNAGGSLLFSKNLKPVVRNVDLLMKIHSAVVPPSTENLEEFKAFVRSLEETIRAGIPTKA